MSSDRRARTTRRSACGSGIGRRSTRIRRTTATSRSRNTAFPFPTTSSRSISRFSSVRFSRFRTSNFCRSRPSTADRMLVVTSLGAVAFAGAMAGAAPRAAALPPIVVTVDVAVDLPPVLVSIVLHEAEAIWQPTGVTFIWRRTPGANAAAIANPADPSPSPTALRVTIGDDLGQAPPDRVPLGWIVFEGDDTPAHEIYVSHRNALEFMTNARGAPRPIAQMPMAEQQLMLGRAMGRALAHEMGHYLLASK